MPIDLYEAAKPGEYPKRFVTLAEALAYLPVDEFETGPIDSHVRPWLYDVRLAPSVDYFLLVNGMEREPRPGEVAPRLSAEDQQRLQAWCVLRKAAVENHYWPEMESDEDYAPTSPAERGG